MTRGRKLRRAALGLAALLVVVLVAGGLLGAGIVRRPWPQASGQIALDGLTSRVTVLRDARGVPQIYADDPVALFRAQGFVAAQDRFFEMDLRRQVASGRLAELVGRAGLDSDRVVRTFGWRAVAEAELPKLAPATRQYLGAYAEGVNDYLARAGDPASVAVEYVALGTRLPDYRIEKWSEVDSLVWLKAIAWDLRGGYTDELTRARLAATLPAAQIAALYPPYPGSTHLAILSSGDWPPGRSIQSAGLPRTLTTSAATSTGAADATTRPSNTVLPADSTDALASAAAALDAVVPTLGRGEGTGSNSWVVGPSRSGTGRPLLANDPHLSVSQPGPWMQVGLHCRTVGTACPFDVAGFTFSGLPGVVVGHNGSIAWGLTNLPADASDVYLEQVLDTAYLRDGVREPLTVTTETLKVRGGEDVPLVVRRTGHGPIISDVVAAAGEVGRHPVVGGIAQVGTYAVSLAWSGLTPATSADSLVGLATATDFTSFRTALRGLSLPQNFVYADTSGNIGYQATGFVPVRRASTAGAPPGYLPSPGWDSRWDWTGWVPFEDLPWSSNPKEGLVVAANQQVTGSPTPYLATDWDAGYRSQRIRSLLAGLTTVTPADMARIQADTTDEFALTLVPTLLAADLSGDSFTAEARDLLRGWDGTTPADSSPASAAAAYANAVWATLLKNTFDDQLPVDLWADGGSRWRAAVTVLLGDPTNAWWDDKRTPGVVETRDELVLRSLVQARLDLTRTMGTDVEKWSWGKLHTVTLQHAVLGGESMPGWLARMVNRGPIGVPGGSSIVDANGWNPARGYAVVSGPSMRMVVDLGDLDASTWVNQSGQSGHPHHPHYSDQIDAWAAVTSYPWPFTEHAVRAGVVDELTLAPRE